MRGQVAEDVARASYGRLVSLVSSRTGDIASAEDALGDAFVAALTQWPVSGVPDMPEAWLLTAARRRLLDGRRRSTVRAREADAVAAAIEALAQHEHDTVFPDERLRLLFVCTHPAIDPLAQVPLMLQTVLGLDAEAIGSAHRVSPKTMGQRLWRAKTKIREAAISFDVPEPRELPQRVEAVLEAIYVAFGTAWEDVGANESRFRGLTDEAISLGRLVCALLPDEAEAHGLLALMLFADARRAARRTEAGDFVPLEAQDPARWSAPLIHEAEARLQHAFTLGRMGPYQLEAALQSAHVVGLRTGSMDHAGVLALYDGLVRLAPSLGALVGRAAALLEAHGAAAAIDALDDLDVALTHDYQPYWAVRADALRRAGRHDEAQVAYVRAIGLTEDDAVRRFLSARAARQ